MSLPRQVMGMLSRAVVRLVDAAKKMQTAQVEACKDDVRDDVERWEQYGFTSVPLDDAEGLLANLGASADHPVLLCVADRRYRLTTLVSGEVALYDDQGAYVLLSRTGIRVVPKAGQVVELGGTGLVAADGLVHGTGIDPFTGATYAALGNASAIVRGKKV